MSVKERLIKYLEFKKISKSEFGRVIGVSSAFVTSMRSSIQPDKIKRIALKYPDLNTEWLLTGEPPMLKNVFGPARRIDFIMSYMKINLQQLCEVIGMEYESDLEAITLDNEQPKEAVIDAIVKEYPFFAKEWLMYGVGEPRVEGARIPQCDPHYYNDNMPQVEIIKRERDNKVLLLPISASAGRLADWVASIQEDDCEKIYSPVDNVDFAITIAGDSMAPRYPSGCRVFIKKINHEAFIEWGKEYVLDTCNGPVLKVCNASAKDGYIKCTSLNIDQNRYAPFDIPTSEINAMYRIMGTWV